MPVIVFTSLKGDVGKTTAATILGTELVQGGASVTMIDASPNRKVVSWAERPGLPENLTVIGVTQENIVDRIAEAASRTAYVIVDLEHSASLMRGYAIGLADFVIIPMHGWRLDATQATRATILMRRQERVLQRSIRFAVLITRTKPGITPRAERYIEKSFAEAQVPVLRTQLHDREAYRALFAFGGILEDLAGKGISNLELAIANARLFAVEVVEQLRPVTDTDLSAFAT